MFHTEETELVQKESDYRNPYEKHKEKTMYVLTGALTGGRSAKHTHFCPILQ